MPAEAGIQKLLKSLDSGIRRDDDPSRKSGFLDGNQIGWIGPARVSDSSGIIDPEMKCLENSSHCRLDKQVRFV